MSYIEESLSSGEVIHKVFQLHWFAKVPMYCWLVLGLVTFGLTWLLALYEEGRGREREKGGKKKRVRRKKGRRKGESRRP